MPKQALALALLCTAAIGLLGCAAQPEKPGFVGTWFTTNFNPEGKPTPQGYEAVESSTLRVWDDGAALLTFDQANGPPLISQRLKWEAISDTRARMALQGAPYQDNAYFSLVDDDTLIAAAPDDRLTYTRQSDEAPPE